MTDWTETELSALRRAYASGTTRVSYDGKSVDYGSAEDLLARLGLLARFAVVLGGDTGAGRKPDPTPLRHVATHMGATRAVMVGDSIHDAGAARAAGWPILLYRHGYRDRAADLIPADARFDDWAAMPGLLEGLAQAA